MNISSIIPNYQSVSACRYPNFQGKTSVGQTNPTQKEPKLMDEYMRLKEYGKDKEAEQLIKDAVEKVGAEEVREQCIDACSTLTGQGKEIASNRISRDILVLTGVIPKTDLPEKFALAKLEVQKIRQRLSELEKQPKSQENEDKKKELEAALEKNTTMVKKEIKAQQKELKAYGAGIDRYDQIQMDRIQDRIRFLREIVPVDRTNLKEVLEASPDLIFAPLKADNIKGNGISFKPVIPDDPEKLKKVTYKAVPLYTNARTMEELIRLAKRDGVKIELVKDAEGNYCPGVKNIWSEGGYFRLDRDSFIIQYGEIPADDPYVDHAWAEKNKYKNKEGKYVIRDCAIVASDKKTNANIMPNSYVKADGSPITRADACDWDGFEVHKDPNGIINAVAFDDVRTITTLEGTIETDVTMGDVEGNVYNKYKDLKKQIINDKIQANPDDPNSQKFIDLVKAGDEDAAIALLREATKE